MSNYDYRIIAETNEDDTTYSVREIYYDDNGIPMLYDEQPPPLESPLLDDLNDEILLISAAQTKPVLITDETALYGLREED